jgi:branched-subunit amino acid permease
MGVNDDSAVARDVLYSGAMAGFLMAVIYIATILMGAQSRGLFETSENGGIALAQISNHYLGGAGSIVLALTITFACLKTSIGLVTSCADAFARMFPKGFSYKTWAIIFTVLPLLLVFMFAVFRNNGDGYFFTTEYLSQLISGKEEIIAALSPASALFVEEAGLFV